MTPKDIRIGTRLELDVLNNKGEKTGSVYISQMLEYRHDGSVIISLPYLKPGLYSSLRMRIST